jgi:hypothetical protein
MQEADGAKGSWPEPSAVQLVLKRILNVGTPSPADIHDTEVGALTTASSAAIRAAVRSISCF